jgi:hypothetical protein
VLPTIACAPLPNGLQKRKRIFFIYVEEEKKFLTTFILTYFYDNCPSSKLFS